MMTSVHEDTHARICNSFDGIVTERYVGFVGSHIICERMSNVVEYKLAQANVDSIGYQLQAFVNVLLVLFSIWMFKWFREEFK